MSNASSQTAQQIPTAPIQAPLPLDADLLALVSGGTIGGPGGGW